MEKEYDVVDNSRHPLLYAAHQKLIIHSQVSQAQKLKELKELKKFKELKELKKLKELRS